MTVKGIIAAAAAALAVVGGTAVAATLRANAVTPECGTSCVELYGGLPVTLGHPSFVIDAYDQGQATGTPVVLLGVSSTNPGEDFQRPDVETVDDFFQAGLVSAAVALHYGCVAGVDFANCAGSGGIGVNDAAFEIQYAPFGAVTGECVGVAATATAGEHVTLQPCGVSGKTVWIVDSTASITGSLVPLINGSDTNFSNPFVLTYPAGASPTSQPTPVLYVTNLAATTVAQAPDTQLWSTVVSDAYLSIAQPANITVDATRPSGATVTYPLPAVTDPINSATTAVCTPPSGSTFPIGTTTVTCTATDPGDLNSPVSVSFTVTVEGAAAQLASLYQEAVHVNGLLAFTVSIAQHAVADGNTRLACLSLNAVINEARLELPAASAAALITDAKRIEAVLGGCGSRPPF
jgi:hypothetical protein